MVTPPFLQKGDTIAIAAPARKISAEEIQPAIDLFSSWGYNVIIPEGLFAIENQYAGTDKHRTEILQQLLDNPEVKAIIFARGGYGTVRIIDSIDFTAFITNPKWIIGYSDITVLHSHIQQTLGIETIHAIMPVNFSNPDNAAVESIEQLRLALEGKVPSYHFDANSLNRLGEAKGVVTGGNLSILYSLLASRSECDTTGKILFIEDIDEYLYHIDRMMMSLKRAGKLDDLAALAVGGFTDMKDNEVPFGKTAHEIITDAVKEFGYPVIFNVPAGHQADNKPLILGREAVLSASVNSASIRFDQPLPQKGIKMFKRMFKPLAFIIGGFVVLYLIYSLILGRI